MFARIAVTFLAISSALAAPLHGHVRSGYLKDAHKLEPYNQYKTRFNALGCSHEVGTDFYNTCCHPLLKGQSLSSRPDMCDPNSSYYHGCSDTTETTTTTTTTTSPATPSPTTPAPPTKSVTTTTTTTTPHTKPHPTTRTTTTTPPAHTTPTTSKPVQTTTTAGGGGGGSWHEGGVATYFLQNGVAGACGTVHPDTAMIAAMDSQLYGNGGLCGKQVRIVNGANSVVVTVADECPSCTNANSIDLSEAAFEALNGKPGNKAVLGVGQVSIKWQYV